jgi:starch-binding outer membrane protein, SusD/RagB family
MRDHQTKFLTLLLAAWFVSGLTACENLLEVELPGNVTEDALDNPALADILVNGVIADFECAYNNYNFGASAHSDEMWHSSGNLNHRNWGQRKITNSFGEYVSGTCGGNGFGMWTTLHKARFQSEDVFNRLTGFANIDDRDSKLATVRTYGGFVYTYFGETFCQVTIDGGAPMQPAAVLAIARERFESAIQLAQASGNTTMLNAARAGLARVLLDLGDYTGARAAAEQVPAGFVFNATRSDDFTYRRNRGRTDFFESGHHTIAPEFRGLEWKGVPDPRVNTSDQGRFGFDGVTQLWTSDKWPERSTPLPIASWDEAQLIIAEAAAQTNDEATAVGIINALHDRAGLPPYDPATDGPVMDHIIQERSRELFQEGGHRLHDMLRFGLPFFEGTDHIGGTYGNTTCFPLPLVEGG